MSEQNHDLVPKHEILQAAEKKAMLDRYRVRADQLPKIRDTDPQVKALSAKVGDVLKIVRKSATAGEAVYYRVVVNA